MNKTAIPTYQEFIEENLEHLIYLKAEIEKWEKIYNKRIFEENWPESVRSIIDSLKQDLFKTISQTKYYFKRVEEIGNEYAKAIESQLEESKRNATLQGGDTENTNKISS